MRRIAAISLILVLASQVGATAADCMSAKELGRLLRSNGLKEYGSIGLEGAEAGNRSGSYGAYVNFKTDKYLSVKKVGKCLSEPVFLTREEYEERFQFEGEEECDGC